MTQYSSYGIKTGMDIDVAKGILDEDGFFTRTLKNDFFSRCVLAGKGDLSIIIMGGTTNKVAAFATIITHYTDFSDHDKRFLENTCHLTEIQNLLSCDGLYSAPETSLIDLGKHYKYAVKEAIINSENELMLFLSDRETPNLYRWIKVIMSKEPMGFYEFDYEPIKAEIEKSPTLKIKELYRILLIAHYFKTGLAEI